MELAPFIFRLSRELLEVDALECDATLQRLFAPHREVILQDEAGREVRCLVEAGGGAVSGRGLGAFFRRFREELLGIAPLGEPARFCIVHLPFLAATSQEARAPAPGRAPGVKRREAAGAAEALRAADLQDPLAAELLERWRRGAFDREAADEVHQASLRLSMTPGFDELVSLDMVAFTPFAHQLRTVRQVLQRMRGRALLCDEVGLGKTIEAGLVLMEYLQRGLVRRVLVLVPPSLVEQWIEELRRKFRLDFVAYDDPRFRQASNGWAEFERVVASMDTAKREPHASSIAAVSYDLVIVDEAHHLRNRETLAWKLVNRLQKRYILLLTATPVQNDLDELFNLITLLRPGQLHTPAEFRRRYVARGDRLQPRNVGELRRLVSEVMIRNRRAETDVRLPPRQAETVRVELTQAEREIYRRVSEWVRTQYRALVAAGHPVNGAAVSTLLLKTVQREAGSSPVAVLPTLERLWLGLSPGAADGDRRPGRTGELPDPLAELAELARSADPGSKARVLLALLERVQDKVVVFTGFRKTQKVLVELLREAGLSVVAYHGEMGRVQKEEAIREFAASARVLVSTESGGEGRNLQEFCATLVNFDLPWNPMRIEQRIGRLHRIGQKRPVFIYNLAAGGTIEAHLLELLNAKLNLFELVIGELDMILGNLTGEQEFEDRLFDIWGRAQDERAFQQELERLGEQLAQARGRYEAAVALDEALFGGELGAGD
ncbi:MAG: SNF2-related protein [Bacillota bacterium]